MKIDRCYVRSIDVPCTAHVIASERPERPRNPLCCGMLYPYGCTSPAYPRNLSGPAPFADCKTITTTHAKAPNLRRFSPPCRVIALWCFLREFEASTLQFRVLPTVGRTPTGLTGHDVKSLVKQAVLY